MTDEKFDNPNIRRIKASENKRVWPDKKLRTSSQKNPMPEPGQKNKIESILTALPVLMLVIGLTIYFRGEGAQMRGTPIIEESVTLNGTFQKLTSVKKFTSEQRYFWIDTAERSRGARITDEQVELLSALVEGDQVSVVLAPTVSESKTLWVYQVSHDGVLLLP